MQFRVRWIENGKQCRVYASERPTAERIAELLHNDEMEGVAIEEMPGG